MIWKTILIVGILGGTAAALVFCAIRLERKEGKNMTEPLGPGLTFQKVAPRIDARIVVLCFEDGDTETVKDLEIIKAVEMYGNMYVRRMIPFLGGMEVHLSNYAEAGRT